MSAIGLLLGAAIVPPVPTISPPWVEGDDYPVRAFERRWQGDTLFEVSVDTYGRPIACTIVKSSGHSILDDRACAIAVRRARFRPARDSSGAPAYGVFRSRLNWAVDPALFVQSEAGPDFEVSLNQMPSGAMPPISVKYAVMVDRSGRPTGCNPLGGDHPEVLGELGCAKLMQDYRPPAAAGKKQLPIPAVRTAWITFVGW